MPHESEGYPVGTSSEGVPIAVAASALGVSMNAVRKRINRKSIEAYKDLTTGEWRVVIPAPATPLDHPRPTRNGEWSQPTPAMDTTTPATPAAAIIREAIAPFVADLKAAHERIGSLETELRIERDLHAATLAALTRAEGQHEPQAHAGEQFPTSTPDGAQRVTQAPRRGILQSVRRWLRNSGVA